MGIGAAVGIGAAGATIGLVGGPVGSLVGGGIGLVIGLITGGSGGASASPGSRQPIRLHDTPVLPGDVGGGGGGGGGGGAYNPPTYLPNPPPAYQPPTSAPPPVESLPTPDVPPTTATPAPTPLPQPLPGTVFEPIAQKVAPPVEALKDPGQTFNLDEGARAIQGQATAAAANVAAPIETRQPEVPSSGPKTEAVAAIEKTPTTILESAAQKIAREGASAVAALQDAPKPKLPPVELISDALAKSSAASSFSTVAQKIANTMSQPAAAAPVETYAKDMQKIAAAASRIGALTVPAAQQFTTKQPPIKELPNGPSTTAVKLVQNLTAKSGVKASDPKGAVSSGAARVRSVK